MTDLHPAAKPEHVRKVLDNLKALERRMIMADMSRDEPNDDAHLVGKAIIVIESLGSELDNRQTVTIPDPCPRCGLDHPWACVECGETL